MKVAIIGGGAAGFFAAIAVKENYPHADVIIFEKSQKLLAKVKISGGGRCNVTNGTSSISELAAAYPRGKKQLKKAFKLFNNRDTMQWFEDRGVALMTQADNCVFPVSQDSQSIIDCFLNATVRLKINVLTGQGVSKIEPQESQLKLHFIKKQPSISVDKVIVATGGSPKRTGLKWLEDLGHQICDPVPSLFTFNMPSENITRLMGIVVENAWVKIQGTKLTSSGPLLITHWGMSGPAMLKLSAHGARILADVGYQFIIQVNWIHITNNELVISELKEIIAQHPHKLLSNYRPFALPGRLWKYLLVKSGLPPTKIWSELGKAGRNKLTTLLTNDTYGVAGKTTFKEEFVTCGGVNLESIDFKTMESKVCKNLYFAGEILDIDGITGGFNFQSAWTTAFLAAKLGNNENKSTNRLT